MPTIEVDGATAALLIESRDIIQNLITGKSASKTLVCPDVNPDGTEVKFAPPIGEELPARGFDPGASGFLAPSADSAASLLASARGPAQRLFAFGYDAWLLVAYLDRLAADPNASVPGATGRLRLDGFGNVVRTPAWTAWIGDVATTLGDAGG